MARTDALFIGMATLVCACSNIDEVAPTTPWCSEVQEWHGDPIIVCLLIPHWYRPEPLDPIGHWLAFTPPKSELPDVQVKVNPKVPTLPLSADTPWSQDVFSCSDETPDRIARHVDQGDGYEVVCTSGRVERYVRAGADVVRCSVNTENGRRHIEAAWDLCETLQVVSYRPR